MKDLLLRAPVVVRTSNMKISRRRLADYVKTLHQKACRTCSTIIFLHSTNGIIDLWHCRWRCRRQILNSLITQSRRLDHPLQRRKRRISTISQPVACKAWVYSEVACNEPLQLCTFLNSVDESILTICKGEDMWNAALAKAGKPASSLLFCQASSIFSIFGCVDCLEQVFSKRQSISIGLYMPCFPLRNIKSWDLLPELVYWAHER